MHATQTYYWNLLQVGTRGLWLCKKGTNKPLYSSVVCGGPYMHYMQALLHCTLLTTAKACLRNHMGKMCASSFNKRLCSSKERFQHVLIQQVKDLERKLRRGRCVASGAAAMQPSRVCSFSSARTASGGWPASRPWSATLPSRLSSAMWMTDQERVSPITGSKQDRRTASQARCYAGSPAGAKSTASFCQSMVLQAVDSNGAILIMVGCSGCGLSLFNPLGVYDKRACVSRLTAEQRLAGFS